MEPIREINKDQQYVYVTCTFDAISGAKVRAISLDDTVAIALANRVAQEESRENEVYVNKVGIGELLDDKTYSHINKPAGNLNSDHAIFKTMGTNKPWYPDY